MIDVYDSIYLLIHDLSGYRSAHDGRKREENSSQKVHLDSVRFPNLDDSPLAFLIVSGRDVV
jgi:hypothetical protein